MRARWGRWALAVLAVGACDGGAGDPPAADAGARPGDGGGGGSNVVGGGAEGDAGGDAAVPDVTVEGAEITSVEPHQITARGGAPVTIRGQGFVPPLTVTIGGAPATPVAIAAAELTVLAPPLPAGPADVAVTMEGAAPIVVEGAITVTPLVLSWVAGVPEAIEAPEAGEVRGAVAVDADRDGDRDLVLATDDGLRVLVNDGQARFTVLRGAEGEPERPGGRADVRALAAGDVDGDGADDVVACTGAGRDLLLRGTAAGLVPGPALPWRPGGCRAVTLAHVDRDGLLDVVTAQGAPDGVGLHALIHDIEGTLWPDVRLAPASEQEGPVGAVASADPAAALAFDRALGPAHEGAAFGRLTVALTEAGPEAVFTLPAALPQVPDRLRLAIRGDALVAHLRLVDADGVVFDGPPLPIGAAWAQVATEVAAMVGPPAEAPAEPPDPAEPPAEEPPPAAPVPAPPIASVALVFSSPAPVTGTVEVDLITAERDGFVPWLVEDFERRDPLWLWPGVAAIAAGDLDADGLDDLVVLPGDAAPAPTLLRTRGAALPATDGPPYLTSVVAAGGDGPYMAAALLHADGDGALDAVVVSGTQDRLLIGDGWGQLLDATAGALPVDWSAGRSVVVADVDRDGAPDLVVGNAGQTDRLYHGLGDGRFVDRTVAFGFDDLDTVAAVVADLDGDGDDDVASVPRAGSTAPAIRIAVGEDEP